LCLSVPLSLALSGPALAATDTHGKATAPGQLAKAADPVVGPVAAPMVGPVAPETVATSTTTTTAATTPSTAATPATTSLSSPQPLSGADMNSGGANNGGACGAYCSTRDLSPSLNGHGTGKSTGKPCAGCVGKADNKNPPGQAPNGTDANAGYECDRNSGVGKTNPAHTGCKTPPCVVTATHPCTPPCVVTATNSCTPPCVVTATNTCTISGGGGGGGMARPPAGPPVTGRTHVPATLTGGPGGPGSSTPTLPFTGSPTGLLAQLGLALALMGSGLLLLGAAPRLARHPLALRV
jgi:hypothetical protein